MDPVTVFAELGDGAVEVPEEFWTGVQAIEIRSIPVAPSP
jgi:hypothetical protein